MRGQTNVARAYVEGLERDRRELHELQQRYDRLVWEMIQTAAYNKALYICLHQFAQGRPVDWARVEDLLEANRKVYSDVWSCECGHHKWDHDENGRCEFIGCRHICGK